MANIKRSHYPITPINSSNYRKSGFVSAFLLFAALAPAAAPDPSTVDRLAQAALARSGAPGLALAIVDGDKIVYAQGYGLRRAGSPDPVTPGTVFAIGSITKSFTAAAIAALIDDNRAAWDDPVRKHLPWFHLADPAADGMVTLRDLLTHRTGLAPNDMLWSGAPWPLEESVRRAGLIPLTRGFRAAYQYNNLTFNAAGFAAAATHGTTWRDLVTTRLLTPAGMLATRFTSSEAAAAPDHATPHNRDAAPIEMYNDDDQIRPAGSLKSTAADLARWMIVHLNGGSIDGRAIVSPRRIAEMHSPQFAFPGDGTEAPSAYGLGWALDNYNGDLLVAHGGAVSGFRSYLAMVPKRKLGVVVLTNIDAAWVQNSLALTVLDTITGAQAKDWHAEFSRDALQADTNWKRTRAERNSKRIPNTRPSLDLAAYEGVYEEPAYGKAWIARDGGKLWLRWSSFRLPLAHYHYDVFDIETADIRLDNEQIQFSLDREGRAGQLTLLGRTFRKSLHQPLDHAKAADRIVGAVKPQPAERVLIRYDATEHPLLADALLRRIPQAKLIPQHQSLPAKILDDTDVYLWLPVGETSRPYSPPERASLAAWLDQGGARRQIHFHWADGSRRADGLTAPHTPALDAMYEQALAADPTAIATAQDKAIATLRRTTVHIRTPAGTDFYFRTGARPFNRQNGDASAERMKTARVRVDREIELPAGVIRVAPVEQTAFGIIVLPEARFGDTLARDVGIYIDNGKVTRVRASQGQAAVEAALTGPLANFREFGLGFNPALTLQPDGTIPYFGYGAGVVRLGLGDNHELGGAVRGGQYRWLFLPDATVNVDATVLVKDGKLL